MVIYDPTDELLTTDVWFFCRKNINGGRDGRFHYTYIGRVPVYAYGSVLDQTLINCYGEFLWILSDYVYSPSYDNYIGSMVTDTLP